MARKKKETAESKSVEKKNEWHGINAFNWCGYQWIARPLWGLHHKNDKLSWYDEDAWYITSDGTLVLQIMDNPRSFVEDGENVTIPWGRASVRCTKEFKYGTFEWDMRLPYGKYLWPALWLSSDTSWPPEIDCMEGWSGDNPDYVKMLLFKNIKPTMHWSENCDSKNGKHLEETKNNTCRWWIKGGKEFDHYKVIWTPDYVEVWYNNHKIKKFTDREMLKHMNSVEMHPIMSTHMYGKFDRSMYTEYRKNGIEMAVRNFKYTPYGK